MISSSILSFSLLVICTVTIVNGHAVINEPPQRGLLTDKVPFAFKAIDNNAPVDRIPHHPSGEKYIPGLTGLASQRAATNATYQLFNPYDPDYVWPTGVCGDGKNGIQYHLRGGKFYYGAKIVGTYEEGSVMDLGFSVAAHHRGFFEFHVCDVSKCGGEISESCFLTEGACRPLKRVRNPDCESGKNFRCGPIDESYPNRWYLPCSLTKLFNATNEFYKSFETFGQGAVQYRLPSDFTCEHCVFLWHWTTANGCNPPGLREYFDGPNAPQNWGRCEGGINRNLNSCGLKYLYPQQYFNCADIRIVKKGTITPTPSPQPGAVNGSAWLFKRGSLEGAERRFFRTPQDPSL